jgi:hypothetical protein
MLRNSGAILPWQNCCPAFSERDGNETLGMRRCRQPNRIAILDQGARSA